MQIAGSGKAARPARASVGPAAPRTQPKPSTGRTPAKQSRLFEVKRGQVAARLPDVIAAV